MSILRKLALPHPLNILFKSFFLVIFITGSLVECHAQSKRLSKKEIRQIKIDSIFTTAESKGLDTRTMLRYEFYFTNKSKNQLEKLSHRLERDSFELIAIEEKKPESWQMSILKNDVLSRQRMDDIDKRLHSLAYEFVIDAYSGFSIHKFLDNPLKIPDQNYMAYLRGLDDPSLFAAANYLFRNESYNRSILAFEESIHRHFREDTAQFQIGNALIKTNELVHGIEHWEAARNLNKRYLEAYLKLGDIFFENSHFNRSLYNYQEADTIKSNDDVILYKIASNLLQLKRYKESYAYAVRAHKINRKNKYVKGLIQILSQPAIRRIRKK